MYLTHHYFVDLIGGSILAASVFYYAQRHYLPQIQPSKTLRWDYEYIVRGSDSSTMTEFSRIPALETDLELGTDTEWAIGSSTSSGNTTPVTESSIGWNSDSSRAAKDDDIDEALRHIPPSPRKVPSHKFSMKKKVALA